MNRESLDRVWLDRVSQTSSTLVSSQNYQSFSSFILFISLSIPFKIYSSLTLVTSQYSAIVHKISDGGLRNQVKYILLFKSQ